MAERPSPVIPSQPQGAASSKREISTWKFLAWLGGVLVLAAGAFAVIRFVDFGGGDSQPAAAPATVPPEPEPEPPPPSTTTTTTEAFFQVTDDAARSAEDADAGQQASETDDGAPTTTTEPLVEDPVIAPVADAEFVQISDAGGFEGTVWLRCDDYSVVLGWEVEAPFELDEFGNRNRTPAPYRDQGRLRATVQVPEHAVDPPERAGLLLEASGISGRGTDGTAEGQAQGVVRNPCGESEPYPGYALWSITVEGHDEIGWTLLFRSVESAVPWEMLFASTESEPGSDDTDEQPFHEPEPPSLELDAPAPDEQ